ncbi:MAG: WG repeat-containing protein [Treponema sp.]
MNVKQFLLFLILFFCFKLEAKDYSKFFINDKCGLIDENRKIILEPVFKDFYKYGDSYFFVTELDDSIRLYDKNLALIYKLPKGSSVLEYYFEDELKVHIAGEMKLSLINMKTGKINDYKKNDKYIEEYGARYNLRVVLLEPKSEDLKLSFSVVDKNKNEIINNISQTDSYYTEGLLPVITVDGRSGFINKKGIFAIKVKLYDDYRMHGLRISPTLYYPFSDGVAIIQTEKDKWFVLDKESNIKEIPSEYSRNFGFAGKEFSNGLTVVENNEHKFGYINKKIELSIPCIFDLAENFMGKYAAVKYQGRDAVIDTSGNIYYSDELK